MKKRILVVGEHFSENLGDGVICQSVEFLIAKNFPDYELVFSDLSGRLTFMNEYKGQERFSGRAKYLLSKWTHRALNKNTFLYSLYVHGSRTRAANIKEKSNQEYDLAVFAGGQMFMDYFSIPIHRHMEYLSKNNTPTIFNACGMGRIKSTLLQNRLQKALSHPNIDSISARDHLKQMNEKLLATDFQATQSHDCALWTKEAFNIQKEESQVVGLGVISLNQKKDKKVIKLYTNVIDELNNRGIQWELFCNGSFDDYELALKIARLLNYDESVIAKRPLSPTELVQTIANYRSIISFRLHSHIIAVSLNIPTVAIAWDNKVDFFFENIQHPDRVFQYDSHFQDVLTKLFEAEQMGYDNELIKAQKEECHSNLIENISVALENDSLDQNKTPVSSLEA